MRSFFNSVFILPIPTIRFIIPLVKNKLSSGGYDLQVHGKTFFKIALHAAEQNGIAPILVWGSLLGCVREGYFIKNDQDIDLALAKVDPERLESYKRSMLAKGFNVRHESTFKLSLVHPKAPNLFIDMDIIIFENNKAYVINEHSSKDFIYRYPFPTQTFTDLQKVRFIDNIEVNIPKNPELFLNAVYGEEWHTPSAKKDYRTGPLNTEIIPKIKIS